MIEAVEADDVLPLGRRLALTMPEAAEGLRLDRALADLVAFASAEDGAGPSLSRARLQALLREGRVRVDGRPATDAAARARAGQAVEIDIPEPAAAIPLPEDLSLVVLFEDEHLIIVDKPPGMAAHPAPGTPSGTLVNALLHHCRERLSGVGGVLRPGVVHRLDKDTSGVMVAAKTDLAHQGLSALFAAHDIERRYVALVARRPDPPSGTVDTLIGRARYDRQRMAVLRTGGRRAVTHYAVERSWGPASGPERIAASRLAVTLETGRTHQIRVHMASKGSPVLADPLYGSSPPVEAVRAAIRAAGLGRQALHAAVLGFRHPATGADLRFETAPPTDMARLESELDARFFAV